MTLSTITSRLRKLKPTRFRLPEPRTQQGRAFKEHVQRIVPAVVAVLLVASIGEHLLFQSHATTVPHVPGQDYQICDNAATYLTSPWTYHALASGTQSYTVAQYQALTGYGTTLPPLPSYISAQGSAAPAAVIYAPGNTADVPAYDNPETPVIHFFEGGNYGMLAMDAVSGDEFIGGSTTGFGEPKFDSGNNAGGINAQNGSYYFSGGTSTLAGSASAGATTITTTSAIPGYIQYFTFADGKTYQIASNTGTSYTLSSALTSAESSGQQVWANSTSPIAKVSASGAQGATTVTLTSSTIPIIQWQQVNIGDRNYTVTNVTGTQSGGYTITLGGLDVATAANTPVYYSDLAGGVTVSYLDIAHDSHNTTGTIYTGVGWTVTHNNIHDGYMNSSGQPEAGLGVAFYGGDQGTVEYNCFSKMGDYAANVFGTNAKFDYNEVYESNYLPDPGCGCSGGGKWWGSLNADIDNNAFINNGIGDSGTAIWLDNGNTGTDISGNYFNKTMGHAISAETGFNLNITGNLFQDDLWGSGAGPGNSNNIGDVSMNSSGGFNVPNSRYENQVNISGNTFSNDWGGIGVWESGARNCLNSGETWSSGLDAPYCTGGFPNSANTNVANQYYFSHIGDSGHFGGNGTDFVLAQNASAGATQVLVNGSVATNDQIGFADPVQTSTTSTTNVTTLSGSQSITVASTTGFPSSGQLRVQTNALGAGDSSPTGAVLSYTGKTATTFTGVAFVRGKGSLNGWVEQVQPYKATSETCYANDCKVTITPALTGNVTAGTDVTNTGTCQLFATAGATPASPLAPDGSSYYDGCKWGTAHITVTGNNFIFNPGYISSQTSLDGHLIGANCSASHANDCGSNFMAYQMSGDPPYDNMIPGNAMMSNSLTACPAWDSGCTTNPLKNLNALASPPNYPPGSIGANAEPASNNIWSNNTYTGAWQWYTDWYGSCGDLPKDTTTGKSMPAGACLVDFSHWQSDWQQDAGSVQNLNSPPTTPNSVNASANSATSVTVNWSASNDTGGPGLGGYYIYRNGTQIGSVNSSTTTYTDITAAANTQYSYTVAAYDTATTPDISAQSSAAIVTTPASGQAPSLSLSLTSNTAVHGSAQALNVTATPVSGNTISQAQLFLDGSNTSLQTITTAPYSFSINTLSLADGSHTVTVKATDNQNNLGSQTITVVVTNGDFNGDSKVGISDLAIMASHWNAQSGATYSNGDITGDGKVTISDLSLLASNWNKSW